MTAVIALLVALHPGSAMPEAAPTSQQDDIVIIDDTSIPSDVPDGEKPPFTVASWKGMTEAGQRAYVRVTIEGLEWSPRYASCEALTADSLIEAMRSDVIGGSSNGPLLIHVASAAQRICP